MIRRSSAAWLALAAASGLAAAVGCEGADRSVDVEATEIPSVERPPVLGGRPDRDASPEASPDDDASAPEGGGQQQSERVGELVTDMTLDQLQASGGALYGLTGPGGRCQPPAGCSVVRLDPASGGPPAELHPGVLLDTQKGAPRLLAADPWVYLAAPDAITAETAAGASATALLGASAVALAPSPSGGALVLDGRCRVARFDPEQSLLKPVAGQPPDIACDLTSSAAVSGGKLYYAAADQGSMPGPVLYAAELPGGPAVEVARGEAELRWLAADEAAVYWAELFADAQGTTIRSTIRRAAADGSPASELAQLDGRVTALAVASPCAAEPCLYAVVVAADFDAIVKLPRSGGEALPVAGPLYAPSQRNVSSIALLGPYVYWSASGVRRIER